MDILLVFCDIDDFCQFFGPPGKNDCSRRASASAIAPRASASQKR
jgi:hypothetical protein